MNFNDTKSLVFPERRPEAIHRLIVLPHAGGSARFYQPWFSHLSKKIELAIFELPGRGKRFLEDCWDTYDSAIDGIFNEIMPFLDKNFSLFGHSMGAILAYGLAAKFEQCGEKQVANLFLSACLDPALLNKVGFPQRSALPESEILSQLESIGGIDASLSASPELLDIFLPIFREDSKICESFKITNNQIVGSNISVYGGLSDYLAPEDLESWANFTRASYESQFFTGGHFYINEHHPLILKKINCCILEKSDLP